MTYHFVSKFKDRAEWRVLNQEEIELLKSHKVCRVYTRGEIIFNDGDPSRGIYCIESGLVGILKFNLEGNSLFLRHLVSAGGIIGYRSLLAGEKHRNSAKVLEDGLICFIDRGAVMELLGHNPNFGLQFLKMATKALGEAEEEFLQLVTLNLRARIAHLLLILTKNHGTSRKNGAVELELPLSRIDLAAMVGANPESVSRTISKMGRDGVAIFSGRKVNIPEVADLLKEFDHKHNN